MSDAAYMTARIQHAIDNWVLTDEVDSLLVELRDAFASFARRDPNAFQQQLMRTLDTGLPHIEVIKMCCFGLAGEAGETVDAVKKMIYQHHPVEKTRMKVKDELGDTLWYIACLADHFGLTMSEIMAGNRAKLGNRYPEGFDAGRSMSRDKEAERNAVAGAT